MLNDYIGQIYIRCRAILSIPDDYKHKFIKSLTHLIRYNGRTYNRCTRDAITELSDIANNIGNNDVKIITTFIISSIYKITRFQSFLVELAMYHKVLDKIQHIMEYIIENHSHNDTNGFTPYSTDDTNFNQVIACIIYNLLKSSGMEINYSECKAWWNPRHDYVDTFGLLYIIVTILLIIDGDQYNFYNKLEKNK
ncbi:hypothetical protein BI079_gp174 [Volepox virus]|uniref:Uncharacterized protein n=1 Tax=Volepox virus TaxID=28874 RepID=A0A1C9KCI7_9POXV|nr:hypothetical protein BI079_gp174 [Volepox virus]AOP31864.1 hypothetical protein VPXV-CA-174 [Volepox virus]